MKGYDARNQSSAWKYSHIKSMDKTPTIGVSACLLGQAVRYDGTHKRHELVCRLREVFHCVPICPETAIGMGVPREPIRLVQNDVIVTQGIQHGSLNVAHKLRAYADSIKQQYPTLQAYVFKARSPSCGLKNVPLFDSEGASLAPTQGIFAAQLGLRFENLICVEETDLSDVTELWEFVEKVRQHGKESPINS